MVGMMRGITGELVAERLRIDYRAQVRRIARAMAAATDAQLMRWCKQRDCDKLREMGRRFVALSNDKLDEALPPFFVILQEMGFGRAPMETVADEFINRLHADCGD